MDRPLSILESFYPL